jgi:hypothetical protein
MFLGHIFRDVFENQKYVIAEEENYNRVVAPSGVMAVYGHFRGTHRLKPRKQEASTGAAQ